MFETMGGVELLEGYKRVVCDTCRYSKIPWRHSCVARATAICILHIVESLRSYNDRLVLD